MPDEKASPTQPHPPDKLRYARNVFNIPDDLVDFTPALRAEALERTKFYKWAPTPFNPPIVGNVNGRCYGAITVGTATNWPGGGYDPELHIAFAPAGNMPGVAVARRAAAGILGHPVTSRASAGEPFREVLGPGDCCAADSPRTAQRAARGENAAACRSRHAGAAGGGAGAGLNVQGIPMIKPPYGMLAAINLDRGELMWQTPHGDTPDAIRNHPALKG